MLPAKQNKIDLSSMTEEERKLFRLYGKLPTNKDIIGQKLKERKYFDSGDYALSKAGKTSLGSVGTAIPSPDTIPHASPPTASGANQSSPNMPSGSPPGISPVFTSGVPGSQPNQGSGSPVKESSLSEDVTSQILGKDDGGTREHVRV